MIVVIVGMLLSLITSLNMTVASIVTAIKNRPRAEYAEPQREHKDTAQAIVDTVATHHIEHVQRAEQRRASRMQRVRPAGRRSSPARRDAQKECKALCAHAAGCFCGEQPQAGKAVRSSPRRSRRPRKCPPRAQAEPEVHTDYKSQFDALIADQPEPPAKAAEAGTGRGTGSPRHPATSFP